MKSSITVVVPAEVTALTTLERVKLELSISDNDDLLAAKIAEASSDIAVRCGPSLRRETVTERFYRERGEDWSDRLVLRRYPITAVTEVSVDDEVQDAAEYRVDGESGILYRQFALGGCCWWQFSETVAVTYTAGYLLPGQVNRDLPASLEAACVELVASYWASRGRDPLVKAEENPGVYRYEYWVGSVGATSDLPPGVMSKIAPYRRIIAR